MGWQSSRDGGPGRGSREKAWRAPVDRCGGGRRRGSDVRRRVEVFLPTAVEQGINQAIGQDGIQVTMLQMARMVASLVNGGILGPHFSFTWYRGSPIGRERKTEERTRADVNDINIQGHPGFVALGEDPMIGKSLCEVGIQFDDDFIEWSISFSQKPFPDPCDIAKELARQSIANAK